MKNNLLSYLFTLLIFLCGFLLGVYCMAMKQAQPEPAWEQVAASPVCTLEYREVRVAPEALSFTF